ncbi:hypothetical protein Taro_019253 [Colocasia esculenta]|uniref:Uncharacterized protein n=1 Tax=Colocasia esculenta TaxID=4460 RepID=A0A843UYP5_COLES|nr:hypothetical protein [Colocasia esculenta]
MQSCIHSNPNSCLTMRGGFLMPHTLKGRRKSSKIGNQTCQSRNPLFLVIIGLLNTMVT